MASDSKSRLLGFWREQLVTDGGQLQVALEVFSTIAVAVAAGTVLPAFLVGSYSIVLLSLAGCLIVSSLALLLSYSCCLTLPGGLHVCSGIQASLCGACCGTSDCHGELLHRD